MTRDSAFRRPTTEAPTATNLNFKSEIDRQRAQPRVDLATRPRVALLTAGRDRPYALGMATALLDANIAFDIIGGSSIDSPILHDNLSIRFLEFRDDAKNRTLGQKVLRILQYYARLLRYSWSAAPEIFHILWNNKFEWIDRTLLTLAYKLCGRKLVFTAHNVNAAKRDGCDSLANRVTLSIQYRLMDHIFVHTEQMRRELLNDFQIPPHKCTVIPFGINATVPNTTLDTSAARRQLGLSAEDKVLLFFGNIAPYKGLEHLVEALKLLPDSESHYRLLIAGGVKGATGYWERVRGLISTLGLESRVVARAQYIPDEETEVYFKAADLLVLPYKHIFQSGVLFLGYNFGLPVVASDVGSLREDIVEQETGFVCRPEDPESLAAAIQRYFDSGLYRNLETHRPKIRQFAAERYSWSRVAAMTSAVYCDLLQGKV